MIDVKDNGILIQIKNHCDRIQSKTRHMSKEEFLDDMDVIEIICFNIFQIGELAKKLSDVFVKEYNKIPWKYVKGMRDKIGHGYDTIDYEIVWETANSDIEDLQDYCEMLIVT